MVGISINFCCFSFVRIDMYHRVLPVKRLDIARHWRSLTPWSNHMVFRNLHWYATAYFVILRRCWIWMHHAYIKLSHSISLFRSHSPMSIHPKSNSSNWKQRQITEADRIYGYIFIQVRRLCCLCKPNGSMPVPTHRWAPLTPVYERSSDRLYS